MKSKTQVIHSPILPPRAQKIPRESTVHGHERVDFYDWMKQKDDPAVLDYIKAENAYTASFMKDEKKLEEKLFQELVGRIKESDSTVPVPLKGNFYYVRTEKGKQYRIYCRKQGSLQADEEILLDVNLLAKGKSFCSLGSFQVSPDQKSLLYSVDTSGNEEYTVFLKDLDSGRLLPDRIEKTAGQCVWATDNRTFLYTTFDAARRPDRLYSHRIGTARSDDRLLFHESDESFALSVTRTRSDRYLMLLITSHNTSEMHFIDASLAGGEFQLIARRKKGVEYYVEHHGERFFIRTNEKAENFRILEAPVGSLGRKNWKETVPHREDVLLEDMDAFREHLVIYEKQGGLKKIRVLDLAGGSDHHVTFPEPLYDVVPQGNREFDTETLRFAYESIITPTSVYDYHMKKRESVLLKEDEIKGYDRSLFVTERIFAPARDGKAIPISLAYRKGMKLDGTAPLYLNGYGAYGYGYDPTFSPHRLSLLQRGFVYAIAHIRGGDDLGRQWYKDGRLLKKKNTFYDFISAASCLIREKYTSAEKLVASGRSAGGLLIGAVLNMKPELFGIAIAGVPFVDALNTMLDPSLPLTIPEYEEWGNPQKKRYFDYIKSYSPYDNTAARDYPHILVMTALNDSRVMFWEPLKWTAKLRELKKNEKVLLLRTNLDAGHGGASGRYDYMKEIAFEYTFILKMLGMQDAPVT